MNSISIIFPKDIFTRTCSSSPIFAAAGTEFAALFSLFQFAIDSLIQAKQTQVFLNHYLPTSKILQGPYSIQESWVHIEKITADAKEPDPQINVSMGPFYVSPESRSLFRLDGSEIMPLDFQGNRYTISPPLDSLPPAKSIFLTKNKHILFKTVRFIGHHAMHVASYALAAGITALTFKLTALQTSAVCATALTCFSLAAFAIETTRQAIRNGAFLNVAIRTFLFFDDLIAAGTSKLSTISASLQERKIALLNNICTASENIFSSVKTSLEKLRKAVRYALDPHEVIQLSIERNEGTSKESFFLVVQGGAKIETSQHIFRKPEVGEKLALEDLPNQNLSFIHLYYKSNQTEKIQCWIFQGNRTSKMVEIDLQKFTPGKMIIIKPDLEDS